MTERHTPSTPAVVAKRVDSGEADTAEIRDLARAAGYEVEGELTQTRTEDPAYHVGEGKVAELATLVDRTDASVVIFDNQLGPYQTYNVGNDLPEGVQLMDRFRLILEIFGQRAQTRKAQLQVELAELRYELPRAEAKASLAKRDERPGFMGLGEYDESREEDIKAQISRLRDELSQIEQTEQHRREHRREAGFDLVALAGYTNAGKSTLLRRLAADLDVEEVVGESALEGPDPERHEQGREDDRDARERDEEPEPRREAGRDDGEVGDTQRERKEEIRQVPIGLATERSCQERGNACARPSPEPGGGRHHLKVDYRVRINVLVPLLR